MSKAVFTYDDIKKEVFVFVATYRKEHQIPQLPSGKKLEPYKKILFEKYPKLVGLVKKHVKQVGSWGLGHGYDHLEWISLLSGYVAEKECDFQGYGSGRKKLLVSKSILAGLLRDIERHRGFGEDHMIEGERVAKKLLDKVGIKDEVVTLAVRYHDDLSFSAKDEDLQIVQGSVFDADHFWYGIEREKVFWEMQEGREMSPEKVIHNYKFVIPLRNAWKTSYGKSIGPKLIDFGLAIARHIENKFS